MFNRTYRETAFKTVERSVVDANVGRHAAYEVVRDVVLAEQVAQGRLPGFVVVEEGGIRVDIHAFAFVNNVTVLDNLERQRQIGFATRSCAPAFGAARRFC